MPRSGRRGAGLLDEQLVVEDVRAGRPHRPRRQRAGAGTQNVLCELGVAAPEELVVVEAAGRALRGRVLVAQRSRVGQIGLRRLAEHLNPLGRQHTPQHNRALLAQLVNVGVRHGGPRVDARQSAQRRRRAQAAATDGR